MMPEVVPCEDIDLEIAERSAAGFRLDATGPADDPTWAQLSRDGQTIYLDADPDAGSERFLPGELTIPALKPSLTVRHETSAGWTVGRAEMAYRDLIPDRFGGAYIASHINVKHGGPVPDYVHHHDVALQIIYCHRGWVRVVYQDQGPPFVLEPGDFVLQPPGIRHQVLEASDELFVTEVSCPADHRTSLDHDLALPTEGVAESNSAPGKIYGRGQRFLRHVGSKLPWEPLGLTPFDVQRTELDSASAAAGDLRFLRVTTASLDRAEQPTMSLEHDGDLLLLFVTSGSIELFDGASGDLIDRLEDGSSVAVPAGSGHRLRNPVVGTVLLELTCRNRNAAGRAGGISVTLNSEISDSATSLTS